MYEQKVEKKSETIMIKKVNGGYVVEDFLASKTYICVNIDALLARVEELMR